LYIKLDDTYIGLINYTKEAPTDGYPWLGLLLIHGDYQGYGYGTNAYFHFQEQLKQQGITTLHLGVLETNTRARTFWEQIGFNWIRKGTTGNALQVDVFEKIF
ncbi:MAG: GNAT family N-acetyltransferase, partial [Bacilli bacterium]